MALVEVGGVAQVKQAVREGRAGAGLETLGQDLRYALRTLKRDKGFTLIAVLILGLGIGANVAVFSVVNTMLLRPLPFRDPQQLVWMAGNGGVGGLSDQTYRVVAYEEFARHNKSFQNVTGFVPSYELSQTTLLGYGAPKPVSGVWVAGDFFQTLGVQPMLGRLFTTEETVNYNKGGRPAAILSYDFWQRQFNGDPAIVGKLIQINGRATPVVGVMPASFDFGGTFAPGMKFDFFVPIIMDSIQNWGHMLSLVGRLKPGVTMEQAQAESNVLFPQLKAAGHPEWGTDVLTAMTGLKEHVEGMMRRPLETLWCAVGMILLIVCVNLSNLLLTRAASEEQGICAADFTGGAAREADPAAADGEPGAFRHGSRVGDSAGLWRYTLSCAPGGAFFAAAEQRACGRRGAGVGGGADIDGWDGVRAGSRMEAGDG